MQNTNTNTNTMPDQASIDRDYEIDGADLREEMMLEELEG
jgi:hypothetical protein